MVLIIKKMAHPTLCRQYHLSFLCCLFLISISASFCQIYLFYLYVKCCILKIIMKIIMKSYFQYMNEGICNSHCHRYRGCKTRERSKVRSQSLPWKQVRAPPIYLSAAPPPLTPPHLMIHPLMTPSRKRSKVKGHYRELNIVMLIISQETQGGPLLGYERQRSSSARMIVLPLTTRVWWRMKRKRQGRDQNHFINSINNMH